MLFYIFFSGVFFASVKKIFLYKMSCEKAHYRHRSLQSQFAGQQAVDDRAYNVTYSCYIGEVV